MLNPRSSRSERSRRRTAIALTVGLALTTRRAFIAHVDAGEVDPAIDMVDEHSDNYRSLVYGIRCGACKAVVKEIGDTFDTVAAKHKRDAGPTNVFGSRYVSLFRSTLTREVDGVCAANGAATYANKCWANCAFASGLLGSGARVNFVVDGACANPTRFRNPSFACATACAQVYEPVCGENGVSYSNGCIAECSGVRYVRGSCHA